MGFFSGIDDFLFGGDDGDFDINLGARSDAGLQGAQDKERFNQQGIDEMARSLGITSEELRPFIQSGTNQLDFLAQGATPEGFDERLGKNIFLRIIRKFKESKSPRH